MICPCSKHDLLFWSYSIHDTSLFDLWVDTRSFRDSTRFEPKYDPVRVITWPSSTQFSANFEPWFHPNWLMIRSCLTHVLIDLWRSCLTQLDPVWLKIRPCLTHDSTLFQSWFDPVRNIIRACLTYESSTFFNSRFNLVHFATRNRLTNDSNLYDSIDPDRLMIWSYSSHDLNRLDPRFGQIRTMIRS